MQTLKPVTIEKEEWYQALIEDCQAIITESVFGSRWALIEGYYNLGKRILDEYQNFERHEIYGEKIVQHVAISLGKMPRTIYLAIQLVRKYPDLSTLPEGKNITWHKLCNQYLPDPKKKKSKIESVKIPCIGLADKLTGKTLTIENLQYNYDISKQNIWSIIGKKWIKFTIEVLKYEGEEDEL